MVTQKDMARSLGVSVALISRVLSGKAREIGVSGATVRRIERVAAAMGYVPNANARILRGAPSRTLGVVVYDFADPFFGPLIGELQRLAHADGHSLVLVGFEHRHVEPRDLQPLLKHGVGGVIVLGSGGETGWAGAFAGRHIPVVRIGLGPVENIALTVQVDEARGIGELLRHLRRTGRRQVGFLGCRLPAHEERFAHFSAAVRKLGLVSRPEWQVFGDDPLDAAGYAAACRLLAATGAKIPAAIVAANDLLAMGAIRALIEHGRRVPEDVAVTGFDDIPLAHLTSPALTTVRQPLALMARKAFDGVVHPAVPPGEPRLVCRPELVIRESA